MNVIDYIQQLIVINAANNAEEVKFKSWEVNQSVKFALMWSPSA